ncbi:hypothetical protein ACIBCN_35930 [Nocardia sp. NPDC051052]|uniref:hypothetical protein n=1 Tax=Nocardia sp. NPDC051052 TaxID=3364322 RepID=UPI00379D7407
MDVLVTLVALAIGAIAVWGAVSFWSEDSFRQNGPDPTLRGCRGDDDRGDR